MKTSLTIVVLLGLVVAPDMVLADAAHRFTGAGYDGYDRAGFYQTKPYDPLLVNARFRGAGYDGYDKGILAGTPLRRPVGTVVIIK